MNRRTKADLEAENEDLRRKLESIYDDLGDFLEEQEENDKLEEEE